MSRTAGGTRTAGSAYGSGMHNAIAVISCQNIKENARRMCARVKVPLYAVVKDDAYGHGAEQTAHALAGIASGFCVASVSEGAALRVSGIEGDILVLSPPVTHAEAERAARYRLTLTLSSLAVLRLIESASPVRVHIAVNTGMNRYGFRPEQLDMVCRRVRAEVTGVYSHLYAPEDGEAAFRQLALFQRAVKTVRAYFPNAMCHLAATGGALLGGEFAFDAVRCGIALYGYLPKGFEGAIRLKPAMRVYAPVAQNTRFAGGGVGYRRAERQYSALYTLRAGYGDGFFRCGGDIPPLCMDAQLREGRARFGSMRLIMKDAAAYAAAHGTTAYEVLTRIGAGTERIYE